MIISNKQIMLLITKVHQLRTILVSASNDKALTKNGDDTLKECNVLLSTIANQQSTELKEIE